MNAKFRVACAVFASLAVVGATIAALAGPVAASSSECETVCSLHIGHPSATATGAAELGLQFQSDVGGWIAGVCFWEAPTETGSHTVTLWDSTGTNVATATGAGTPGEEGCVDFNPPAPIAANTTYTASYTSNTAYDVEPGQFFSPLVVEPLSLPVDAGALGAPGSFPTSSSAGDGYGVDVAFLGTLTGTINDCLSTLTAPTSPSTGPGPGSAAVSWTAATSTPVGCIAGYVVTPFLNGAAQPPTLIPGLGTTTVISGLIDGDTYTFTIAAESGQSVGPASTPTEPVTVGTPTAATALKVTHVGNGAIRVAFHASHNNGAAITKYTATCKSAGGATRSKAGKRSPLTVTGLTIAKAYRCTITATNRRGNGPSSRRSAATTG